MAAVIKKTYKVEPKLIAGAGGIFDVKANGKLIFGKDKVGRFPEDDEVLKALASLTAAKAR